MTDDEFTSLLLRGLAVADGQVLTDWYECGCGALVDDHQPGHGVLLRVVHTCDEEGEP